MNSFLLRRLLPFFIFTITIEFVAFGLMSINEREVLNWSFLPMTKTVGVLLLTTTVSFLYLMIPYVIYLTILPRNKVNSKTDRIITIAMYAFYVYLTLFEEAVSIIFWQEFSSAFNFIAVDYLIYTQKVFSNILQSLPIVWYLAGLVIATVIIVITTKNFLFNNMLNPKLFKRFFYTCIYLIFCALTFINTNDSELNVDKSRVNNELAKEGTYSFFSAFWHNEISYDDFYLTKDKSANLKLLQKILQTKNVDFLHPQKNIIRDIDNQKKEKKHNVIVVLMESMSSKFLNENRKQNQEKITPNLSKISSEGIFFSQTYATGTRAVRGVEAIALSIPPLPGLSIVRRKDNNNIYNIGSIFKAKGYDNKWIYGGFGYFDNMDKFFGKNGFEVIDRTHWKGKDVHFANILGASDEDTLNKVIQEADKSFAAEHPFFAMTMTLSNHTPYTFPAEKIDLPSKKSKRQGGVKYSDYAIGQFIETAKNKPWFDNTIFVFVGNRTAGADRVENIQAQNFHVPMIFYAPKIFKPQRYDLKISQIDAMPTLLGLMNFEYESRFYGQDVLQKSYRPRFFISNEQKLGYIRNNTEIMLQPVKEFTCQPKHSAHKNLYLDEAIAYYQNAANWRQDLKDH